MTHVETGILLLAVESMTSQPKLQELKTHGSSCCLLLKVILIHQGLTFVSISQHVEDRYRIFRTISHSLIGFAVPATNTPVDLSIFLVPKFACLT